MSMSGKAFSGLLALALSVLPCSASGAGLKVAPVRIAPAGVSGVAGAESFATPGLAPASPSLALSLPAFSGLSPVAVPRVGPAVSGRVPRAVRSASVFSSPFATPPVLRGAGADASGRRPVPASVESSHLKTAGITRRWSKLYLEGKELELIGRGDFGAVYAHPRDRGAVIKLVDFSVGAVLSIGTTHEESARQDERIGRRLAEAGAGPKVLGIASIPGEPSPWRRRVWAFFGKTARVPDRPAVVKERIYGETVEDLIYARRLTQEDYALIQDMLGRMADVRIRVSDLRTANIMIGRTVDDSQRRAYLVDGGWLLPVKDEESRGELFKSLRRQQTVVMGAGGGGGTGGWAAVETALDPFEDILQAGLTRSTVK